MQLRTRQGKYSNLEALLFNYLEIPHYRQLLGHLIIRICKVSGLANIKNHLPIGSM